MDKKIFAVFKKEKIEIDDLDKIALDEAISGDDKYILLKNRKFKVDDFIRYEEINTETIVDKYQKEWEESIRYRLSLSSKERAEKTIGHFSLWFYAIFGKKPSEEVLEKAKKAITKYYEKNNNLIYPSLKFYFEIIPKAKNRKANLGFRCLERMEEMIVFFKNRSVDN